MGEGGWVAWVCVHACVRACGWGGGGRRGRACATHPPTHLPARPPTHPPTHPTHLVGVEHNWRRLVPLALQAQGHRVYRGLKVGVLGVDHQPHARLRVGGLVGVWMHE